MARNVTFTKPDDDVIELIVRSGDMNTEVAFAAQLQLAKALEEPLRQGVLVGDVSTQWYEARQMPPGSTIEFPLDLLAPGEEDEFVAYTNPGNGRIA